MKHLAATSFWECYANLPVEVKKLADKNFEILKTNLHHPSMHLKKVNNYWSVRVGTGYRALAVEVEKDLLWFWIGHHSEYDKLIEK
ncbi:MAG: hypothetical protein ABRQ38_08635 [Candidatus Eremiobacterota bacterium]